MKRKFLIGLSVCLMMFSFLSLTAAAKPTVYSEGDFYYVIENGSIAITGYFGDATEAMVPASIGGIPVNVIKTDAFVGTTLTTLYLPDTIMNVEQGAFDPDLKVIYDANLKESDASGEIKTNPLDGYNYVKTPEGFMVEIERTGAKIISFDEAKLPEDKKLTIPGKVNDVPVVEIADNVFEHVEIEELRIPSSVKTIGKLLTVKKTILDCDTDQPRVFEAKASEGEMEQEIDIDISKTKEEKPDKYAVTTEEGLIVEVKGDEATVIGVDQNRYNGEKLVIPETIEGAKVVAIKEGALKDRGVKELEIEGSDTDRGQVENDVPSVSQKDEAGDMKDVTGKNYTWAYIIIGAVLIIGGLAFLFFSKKIGKKKED